MQQNSNNIFSTSAEHTAPQNGPKLSFSLASTSKLIIQAESSRHKGPYGGLKTLI